MGNHCWLTRQLGRNWRTNKSEHREDVADSLIQRALPPVWLYSWYWQHMIKIFLKEQLQCTHMAALDLSTMAATVDWRLVGRNSKTDSNQHKKELWNDQRQPKLEWALLEDSEFHVSGNGESSETILNLYWILIYKSGIIFPNHIPD